MPKPTLSVSQHINAPIEKCFTLVSDLTTHGQWAANDLTLELVGDGPTQVGSRYQSEATVGKLNFSAELTVTALTPPATFSFSGRDQTGGFTHHFTLKPQDGGTLVTRTVEFDLTLRQYLFYLVTYFPVRIPAAKASLANLKQVLEI